MLSFFIFLGALEWAQSILSEKLLKLRYRGKMADEKKEKPKKKSGNSSSGSNHIKMAFIGIIVGCLVGMFAFRYLKQKEYFTLDYSIILIGLISGLFCRIFIKSRNSFMGIICALFALGFGLLAEHYMFISGKENLSFFFQNLQKLKTATWVPIIIGSLLAFYLGRGKQK